MKMGTGQKFPLGQLVWTPNALEQIAREDIRARLNRHVAGDWCEVSDEDKILNDRAMIADSILL